MLECVVLFDDWCLFIDFVSGLFVDLACLGLNYLYVYWIDVWVVSDVV